MPPNPLPPASILDPYYFAWHVVFVFILGACFGSFFNVCIYRIPMGINLSKPDSHCYHCGQPLQWRDNVPLIGYWALGGRCRYCRIGYSARYFQVELLTALLLTAAFVTYCNPWRGYSAVALPAMIFVSLLIIATFTDIDHWIIPDRISLGGAAAGLGLAAIWPLGLAAHNPLAQPLLGWPIPPMLLPLANSGVGAIVGFGGLWSIGFAGSIVFRKEAMGQGDMKLFAMFGAFAGPMNCFYILMLSCFIGSAVGLTGLVRSRLSKGPEPTAPVAALTPDAARTEATLAKYPLGARERLLATRALTSPGPVGTVRHHLPFGPSLAVGALIVYLGWEPIHQRFMNFLMLPPVW